MSKKYVIYKNEYFHTEQCSDVPIPGYLILKPIRKINSITQMKPCELSTLGETLSKIIQAINNVIKPKDIYIAKFGESDKSLHFHIFPKTEELLNAYRIKEKIDKDIISGPQLFDWCRKNYKKKQGSNKSNLNLEETLAKIIEYLRSCGNNKK